MCLIIKYLLAEKQKYAYVGRNLGLKRRKKDDFNCLSCGNVGIENKI